MAFPDSITIPYLLLLFVIFPAAAIRAWYRLKMGKPQPPKRLRYRAMIAAQLLLLAITSAVASRVQFPLFAAKKPPVLAWLIAAAYLVLLVFSLKRSWKRMTAERKQLARRLLPENPSELGYWIPISLLAGISEEYAYRGVALVVLSDISGSFGFALTVCVVGFGLAHAMQGRRGIFAAMAAAALFHSMVVLTQGLYLTVAFHSAYDLAVGIMAARMFGREAGTTSTVPIPG